MHRPDHEAKFRGISIQRLSDASHLDKREVEALHLTITKIPYQRHVAANASLPHARVRRAVQERVRVLIAMVVEPMHVLSEEIGVRLDPEQPDLAASAHRVAIGNVACNRAHSNHGRVRARAVR